MYEVMQVGSNSPEFILLPSRMDPFCLKPEYGLVFAHSKWLDHPRGREDMRYDSLTFGTKSLAMTVIV